MSATPTATPVPYDNAANSIDAGFASSMGLTGPLVFVIYAVGVLLAAQFVAPWLATSQLLSGMAGRILESMALAIKGLASTAVLVVVALPAWFLLTAEPSTKGLAAEVVGYGIAAYIALVVLGWLADRAVTAFLDAHPDYDEWDDLFPDEESKEAVADGGTKNE